MQNESHIQEMLPLPNIKVRSDELHASLAQKLIIVGDAVDALLGKLEGSEEDGIHYAGARHGDAETYFPLVEVITEISG